MCRGARPASLGEAGRPVNFVQFASFFGIESPASTTHLKLVELVRTKKNMYGTWCEAQF